MGEVSGGGAFARVGRVSEDPATQDDRWSALWEPHGQPIRLNNGSFGATPIAVHLAIVDHRQRVDADRDHFFRRVRSTEHAAALDAAAQSSMRIVRVSRSCPIPAQAPPRCCGAFLFRPATAF